MATKPPRGAPNRTSSPSDTPSGSRDDHRTDRRSSGHTPSGGRSLQLVDLEADPHNANRGTDRGRAALERSLREYGAGRAVLIDRHGRIIAGNKTVEQAKRLQLRLRVVKTDGRDLIAVQRDDLDLATDPRAQALAIADNRVGELDLQWDEAMLRQLQTDGVDLSVFWTPEEFAALGIGATTGLGDENAVIEPAATDIVRGELFVLGRHRLLCGDATSAGDVLRLFDGATPVLMATDPPYGGKLMRSVKHYNKTRYRAGVRRPVSENRVTAAATVGAVEGAMARDVSRLTKQPATTSGTVATDCQARPPQDSWVAFVGRRG